MKIKYEIKGITLDVHDLMDIHQYYEAACTAEFLMENHNITDENEAMRLGYQVRDLMDKYGYDEAEAIDNALEIIDDGLPTQLYVKCTDIDAKWDEMDDYDKSEAVSDYLSDKYGFCHKGFECGETNGQVHITSIEWDEED